MAHQICVPRLGWSMEVGTFLRWLKDDGDVVEAGDPLYELEGEKASQEIEAMDAGVLRIPPDAPAPGTELPVGALLGYLLDPNEPLPWKSVRDHQIASKPAIASADVKPLKSGACLSRASDAVAAAPTTRPNGARKVSTPRARRVALELGLDWTLLKGTGRNGRVRECDVRGAAAQFSSPAPLAERAPASALSGDKAPASKRRRAIAERMRASQQTNVPVTLTSRADAENLLATRAQFKAASRSMIVPTINDIIIKLVAGVLLRHRSMAGQWQGGQIVFPTADEINVGLAVDTDEGLLVPVVRNAAQTSLMEIARTTSELAERARAGHLSLEQMQGGVFTITNLGPYGVDAFTPVINVPEAAILGLGAIRREPLVRDDDQLAIGSVLTLSLTFDHRIVDGAPAAGFLADVREVIENPVPHLL